MSESTELVPYEEQSDKDKVFIKREVKIHATATATWSEVEHVVTELALKGGWELKFVKEYDDYHRLIFDRMVM